MLKCDAAAAEIDGSKRDGLSVGHMRWEGTSLSLARAHIEADVLRVQRGGAGEGMVRGGSGQSIGKGGGASAEFRVGRARERETAVFFHPRPFAERRWGLAHSGGW